MNLRKHSAAGCINKKAIEHIRHLCVEVKDRSVGSPGNRDATGYFAEIARKNGFDTVTPSFECFRWQDHGSSLNAGDEAFTVNTGPYSGSCELSRLLCTVSSAAELEEVRGEGQILLLKGELAREQLMPKKFVFYNPAEHQRIIWLLETKGFSAVASATERNPELAGGVYPFPLIEDGDFILPSVFMTGAEGEKLLKFSGLPVSLKIESEREPSRGCNVIARKGKGRERLVFCAHIDSKEGSPGAVDNASGVTALLLLMELLEGFSGPPEIEIAALNGEDYYSNPGQMLYISENSGKFSDILLGVNIDGAGYFRGETAWSLYGCPRRIAETAEKAFSSAGLVRGDAWRQGDHGIFQRFERPAAAVTSALMGEVLNIAHTSGDTPEILDPEKIADTARALFILASDLAAGYSDN